MKSPICPTCGGSAFAQETRYGIRHSCCGLWSWDGAPLVDAETHEARRAAHAAFDKLWQRHGLKRGEAYAQLASELGIKRKHCHMKQMDKATAMRVPGAVRAIIDRSDITLIE